MNQVKPSNDEKVVGQDEHRAIQFDELYKELDATSQLNNKCSSLVYFFQHADLEEKSWALSLFMGKKVIPRYSSTTIKNATSYATKLPKWLIEESYYSVGDLAETISLLVASPSKVLSDLEFTLSGVIAQLTALQEYNLQEQVEKLGTIFQKFNQFHLFLLVKLILGGSRLRLRVGVAKSLVFRALAQVNNIDASTVALRLTGNWAPSSDCYERLFNCVANTNNSDHLYPFYLASPLPDGNAREKLLSTCDDWAVEYKWDGIRAQLVKRAEKPLIWSRGEEIITTQFPELSSILAESANNCLVIDGEIVAWDNNKIKVAPFSQLQPRLGRKSPSVKFCNQYPVAFIAYDLLEESGKDIRHLSFITRREMLKHLATNFFDYPNFQLSPVFFVSSISEIIKFRYIARYNGAEGVMLKRCNSPYRSGRVRGDWWKYKIDPYVVDAVLVSAQKGHGRRANLYTDFTFAVWNNGSLVSFAKAYSGLTEEELALVDSFVKSNTKERYGPVRTVTPKLVFEIAFEGVLPSSRHKARLAVLFPRILRWRRDKCLEDADSLDTLKALMSTCKY
jgi:DNA ligase-1